MAVVYTFHIRKMKFAVKLKERNYRVVVINTFFQTGAAMMKAFPAVAAADPV